MANKIFYPPSNLIKIPIIISCSSAEPISTSIDIHLIRKDCLILMLTPNKCRIHLHEECIFAAYMHNNISSKIYGVKLKNKIPNNSNFICASITNGSCSHFDGNVFYNINVINPYSFVKMTLTVRPNDYGTMCDSIKVISKDYIKYTINSPANAIVEVV